MRLLTGRKNFVTRQNPTLVYVVLTLRNQPLPLKAKQLEVRANRLLPPSSRTVSVQADRSVASDLL
jgi:hypothetical protein